MKNLKKVLCLALAFTLLLGVMVVTTGAANFTDNDEIVNTEAVDTMVALSIINGKGDGSYFDPTGIVTRAEMCKMICVALNGGKDPQLGTTAYSYTDTVGNWAAGYIEYCTNLGIVAGRGNGIFDPTGTVTGTEAAKMLLVAIGYDADAEGFTGASWAIAVNVRANQKDFYEDLESIDPSAGLTRDSAAQMVYNAIQAVMVKYTYQLTTVDGQLATVSVAEDVDTEPNTILEKKFDMTTEYGIIYGISYDEDEDEYTYSVEPDEGYDITSFTSSTDYSSLFLMEAKIMYKGTNTDKVYGVYANDSKVMLTGVIDSLPTIEDDDTSFKYGGVTYKLGDTADDIDAYAYISAASITDLAALENDARDPFKFALIDEDGDNKGDLIVVYPFQVAKVSYVGSTSFTLYGIDTFTTDDCDVYDGIAKSDYAIYYAAANTPKGIDTFVKATKVSGEVTALSSLTTASIDGTSYKIYVGSDYDEFKLGSSYVMWVVNGFYFYSEKTSTSVSSDNVCLVNAIGSIDSISATLKTQLLLADGTKTTIYVSSVDGTDVASASDLTKGEIYTYDIDSDGYYELTAINEDDYDAYGLNATFSSLKDGKAVVTSVGDGDTGTYYFADDAVVYYWNGSAYKVTTGASVKNWSDLGSYSGNMFYANNSNGFHYTALAYLQLSATPDSGDLSYGWITSTPVLVKDGDDYYLQMNIWTGSSSETYLAEKYNNTAIDGSATSFLTVGSGTNPDSLTYLKKGYPVVFSDNGDGTITNLSSFVGAINSVVGYADGADDVAFDMAIPGASGTGIRTLTITDDTIILYVDTENDIGYAGGSIEIAEQEEDDDYIPNCYVLANGSDEIKVIVVDSTNEADTLPPV